MFDLEALKEEIQSNISQWSVTAILGTGGWLLKWVFPHAWEQIYSTIFSIISPSQLLVLFLLLLLVNLTMVAFKLTSFSENQP